MLDEKKVREYTKRLLLSRIRLMESHGFYGLLLMRMRFSIDTEVANAATDGVRIYFNPEYLESLSDDKLDFIMLHEIAHIVLLHFISRIGELEPERFNIACDIVVNSLILEDLEQTHPNIENEIKDLSHTVPDGREGSLFTAEEVYDMIVFTPPKQGKKVKGAGSKPGDEPGNKEDGEKESKSEKEKGNDSDNNNDDNEGNDSGNQDGGGKGEAENDSNKDGDGKNEGFVKGRALKKIAEPPGENYSPTDDHSRWGTVLEEDAVIRDVWVKNILEAAEAISIQNSSRGRGRIPAFAKRIIEELRKPQTDWRKILNDFVQEEINDYSFSPPDRRFDDSPFFLPDFNEKDDVVKNILFMIDTSGSMSNEAITAAFSEIYGAIEQFGGKLAGWLGFFDAAVIEPVPFENVDEFKIIEAAGGGGTDFQIIFEYVAQYMEDDPPVSIIILTDGGAPFPEESLANGIPVLWLLNNEEVEPPWGKIARIKV